MKPFGGLLLLTKTNVGHEGVGSFGNQEKYS